MSIYFNEKIDLWSARITLPNGKRKGNSGKTQRVVLDWLIDQSTNDKDGLDVTDDRNKLGDFLDHQPGDLAVHHLLPRTYESHGGYVRNHIKVWITIICTSSSSSVGPEESLNRLSTVRPHPFQNELSQLSVDLFLASFTMLAVWAIVGIRHMPGTLFNRFFVKLLSDRDVSLTCDIGDLLILSLLSLQNTGQST